MKQTDFNQTILNLKPSLIRSIIDVNHDGSYDRISLGLGELSFSMPKKAQKANAQALKTGKNHYTPNAGLPDLRKAIAADFSANHNLSLQEKNILITAGSTGGLFIAFETLLNPKDDVLIPSLHYPIYESIPQVNGAKILDYNLLDDFTIDIDDLLSKITTRTKIIVLNSPSNPTGQVQSIEILQRLAKETAKYPSLFFLSDEVYSTCLYNKTNHATIASFTDKVVVIDGLSKRASMTGKRLGWLIGPEEFIQQAIKTQQFTYTCAPSDSQYAALSLLSGDCDEEITYFQKELAANREQMLESLQNIESISFTEPKGAFYCLVDISRFGTSMEVATKLIKEVNVVTVPGLAFGKAGDKYLRLSFAGDKEKLKEGIKRMKGVLQKWQQ